MCQCGRRAVFRVRRRGIVRVKADDQHDLCPKCFRSANNRLKALRYTMDDDD